MKNKISFNDFLKTLQKKNKTEMKILIKLMI